MSIGVRRLTVLGEFKPFGLIAEALDGKPADNFTDNYHYFLFDPELTRQRDDDADDFDASGAALSDRCDHELFVRGNRIIWTTGARVFKRFTLSSPVVMVCMYLYMIQKTHKLEVSYRILWMLLISLQGFFDSMNHSDCLTSV
ncbi:Anaphase-promoting complex subunit [Trema orientale]|uniref:Anaphase-promoting complex subunit n=1 Tax=Trema orientale TaxID=63057 RepID=A0A2P5EM86_TREOI|nr:Anaphase-promoting complex subunit [Trema orientale]